jgi:phosphoenolpyruvate carboxykinase (ATP)
MNKINPKSESIVESLYQMALKHTSDVCISNHQALVVNTGNKTGRSPNDKKIVMNEQKIWWKHQDNPSPNYPIDQQAYHVLKTRALDYLNSQPEHYIIDGFANWRTSSRIKVRVVTNLAYHALFMRNMLILPTPQELEQFETPDFIMYNAGSCDSLGTHICLDLTRGELVILGTKYAGEMKKGLFSYLHYLMPLRGILSLHSGCNIGVDGDVTLFFGLSGTGKTTLSTEPTRPLIGDDEHCWDQQGVFNIEGGCYAKCIGLTEENEPEIYHAIRYGAVLENVVIDRATGIVDYNSNIITDNTRACYPIDFVNNAHIPCLGNHPKNIILLCCDAFGVIPPVSRITNEQAIYHFINGYTSKIAGTEMGITEPIATFSACYGSAFLIWHPTKYADMLLSQMKQYNTQAWLVNTGWSGGKYGVGKRIKLAYTRAMIDAIHHGQLDPSQVEYDTSPVFNLPVPRHCPNVPDHILQPHVSWTNQEMFMKTINLLSEQFQTNYKKLMDV